MPERRIPVQRRKLLLDVVIFRPDPLDFTEFSARGLIDTGATVSGIGPRVVEALGLVSHGKNRLGSATEERLVDYYLFRLGLTTSVTDAPQWPFVFDRIDGFSWTRDTEFDVIMGMDVLTQCELRLVRDNCTLAFG